MRSSFIFRPKYKFMFFRTFGKKICFICLFSDTLYSQKFSPYSLRFLFLFYIFFTKTCRYVVEKDVVESFYKKSLFLVEYSLSLSIYMYIYMYICIYIYIYNTYIYIYIYVCTATVGILNYLLLPKTYTLCKICIYIQII